MILEIPLQPLLRFLYVVTQPLQFILHSLKERLSKSFKDEYMLILGGEMQGKILAIIVVMKERKDELNAFLQRKHSIVMILEIHLKPLLRFL
ncbi:MAG: hypothetical protein KKB85_03540, partial [Candidatus Altiarchaeota archaeon]|nr:hypothetical protein [Candidatus Altiarchaeota archaeon]